MDIGTGAVVYRLGDDGTPRIISHISDKFTKAEKGCPSNEGKCLIVVWALGKNTYLLEDIRIRRRECSG